MSGVLHALILATASGAPGVIQSLGAGAGGAGSASFGLENDGDLTINGVDGGSDWVSPANADVAAFYQVKVDVTSGSFTSGDTTGSYLDLSTSRSWTRAGAGTVNYDVTFREKATGAVRSTQTGLVMTVL